MRWGDKPSDRYFLLILNTNKILPKSYEPERLIRLGSFNQHPVGFKHMISTITATFNEGPFPLNMMA